MEISLFTKYENALLIIIEAAPKAFMFALICAIVGLYYRRNRYPGYRKFEWGDFFCAFNVFLLIFTWGRSILLSCHLLPLAIASLFMLFYSRIGAIAATALTFNPIIWIINYFYIKNRWDEFSGRKVIVSESTKEVDIPAPPPTIIDDSNPKRIKTLRGYKRLVLIISLYMILIFPVLSGIILGITERCWHDETYIFVFIIAPVLGFAGTWLIALVVKTIILPSVRYVKDGFKED